MLNAETGGKGRTVLFRLAVESGPEAKAALADFGKAAVATQKKISDAGMAATKKAADDRRKQYTAAALDVSKIYQRAELQDFAFRRRMFEDQHRREQRTREQSHKDELRRIQREEQANLSGLRRIANEQHRMLTMRESARNAGMEGFGRFGRGVANVARGVAYSGLVGESNTQKVLDTILQFESIFATVGGTFDVLRGASAMAKALKTVGTAGSVLGGVGAGVGAIGAGGLALAGGAAVVGTVGAGLAINDFRRDVGEYGFRGGSRYGSFSDRIGTGIAMLGNSFMNRWASDEQLAKNEQAGYISAAHWRGQREMQKMQAEQFLRRGGKDAKGNEVVGTDILQGQRMTAFLAARRGALDSRIANGEFDAMVKNTPAARLAALQSAAGMSGRDLEQVRGYYKSASADRSFGPEARNALAGDVAQAEARHKSILSEQLQLVRQISVEKIHGAQTALDAARQELNTSKQAVEETRRSLMSDVQRAALASPEEQMQLMQIARKRKAGEDLTPEELALAGGYNEFRGLFESQAEKRAKAVGIYGVFEEGIAKKAEADAAVAKGELTVNQKSEVVVKLEGDTTDADQIIEKLRPLFEQNQADADARIEKAAQQLRGEMRGMLTNSAVIRSPAR